MRRPPCLALALLVLAAARPAHAAWVTDGSPVAVAAGVQYSPAVIGDGAGGAFIAFEDTRTGTPDIYCQHVLADGSISPGWPAAGAPVCTAASSQTAPRLCSDGAGGVIVAWSDNSAGASNTDIYCNRLTSAGVPAAGWPAVTSTGVAACHATNKQFGVRVVTDGAGGALLAFADQRQGIISTDYTLQHVLGSGAVDPLWPADGIDLFLGTSTVHNGLVFLSDGVSGCWTLWCDVTGSAGDATAGWDTWFTHALRDASSQNSGGAAIVPVTQTPGDQLTPAAAPDGAGGLLVAWRDARTGTSTDIYATRLTATGALAPGWPARAAGLALCTEASAQDQPLVCDDGAAGGFVVWRDARAGSSLHQLFATRMSAGGAIASGWPAANTGGRVVCASTADQLPAALVPSQGGMIALWREQRGTSPDLYAMRLLGDGSRAAGWPATGAVMCGAAGQPTTPVLVSDDAGGAIAVWQDDRTDAGDLYAMHVSAQGVIGPVADVAPESPRGGVRLALASASPSARATRIALSLAAPANVRLNVVDLAGRTCATLCDGALAAGVHAFTWDGAVAPGVYLVRVRTPIDTQVLRVVRLR